MNAITTQQLYDLFIDTLSRCTSSTKTLPEEKLLCDLFEDFDVGVRSFFHEGNLARMRNAGLLDDRAVSASTEIRRRWLSLVELPWAVEEIRARSEWDGIFKLCDALIEELARPRSD